MEETQIDGGEELGDDFYEKIEAPKFVDLTAPDRLRPQNDDRYWFCLRVGCDQKHEEEMDSEEIYKNFVLRVMAARSPNIRFRKTLCRKDPSGNLKCPLTVPAKSSKSRISRMAMVSSISQKIVDGKVKARPLPKTPNEKVKRSSVAAKSLTTPRNKKRLSNPGTFRSVRNPKPTSVAVPKNRVVAKALVFHSPKKKTELSSRVKAICAGMKKLEITDGKKKPLDGGSKKQFRGREVKSRVYDSLRPKSCHDKEDKSSKKLSKKTNKEKDAQQACGGPAPTEGVENDSSDMEIEEKSRNVLLEVCSISGSENEAKVMDGGDKENQSKAMSDNDTENDFRNLNLVETSSQMEKKKKIHETCSKSNQTVGKGGLNRKPKLTNPKPFRLRTDERQILKEKKLHHLVDEPLKEITATARLPGGSSQRKLNKAVHRNETCLEQVEHVSERESDKTEREGEHGPLKMRTACSQASKGAVGRKRSTTTTTQQRCTTSMHQKPNIAAAASQQETRTESTKKKTISLMSQPCRLGVIKESSPTTIASATKVVVLKPVENGASPSSKTSISAGTRRRRRMTVPKEPQQFHGVHTPKSCSTRRVT